GTDRSNPDREDTVTAVDLHYFSADNRWVAEGQMMFSDVQGDTGQGGFFDVDYRPERGVQHTFTGTYLDDTLELNDIGYVQRNDHVQLDYRLQLTDSNVPGLRTRTRSVNVINQ